MALTITLPDELAEQLQGAAEEQQLSVEEITEIILRSALRSEYFFPTPEQVVAKIKALPKNPLNPIPAQGSLAEHLRDSPTDPDFDLDAWNREWKTVEVEMKTVTRANDITEGRGSRG